MRLTKSLISNHDKIRFLHTSVAHYYTQPIFLYANAGTYYFDPRSGIDLFRNEKIRREI